MSGDHNMYQKTKSYLDDFECPRCGHCCQALEEKQEPLYWNVADGWVYADDTSQERVDEKAKREQEPVAEIQTEDMGKPFNAIQVTAHFYAEVPAVGTKLYKAPPKRDLTCVCGAVWDGEMMVHPPRKREWVGLTDEERSYYLQSASNVGWWQAAKMIEAKLKEKNT